METNYKIGQTVYYVECHAYALPRNKSCAYYRPFKSRINNIKIEEWTPWNRKLKKQRRYTVNYSVRFDCKSKNKGYPQHNDNIFANKETAVEYAHALNDLVKARNKPNWSEDEVGLIFDKLKTIRAKEPIETMHW